MIESPYMREQHDREYRRRRAKRPWGGLPVKLPTLDAPPEYRVGRLTQEGRP